MIRQRNSFMNSKSLPDLWKELDIRPPEGQKQYSSRSPGGGGQ